MKDMKITKDWEFSIKGKCPKCGTWCKYSAAVSQAPDQKVDEIVKDIIKGQIHCSNCGTDFSLHGFGTELKQRVINVIEKRKEEINNVIDQHEGMHNLARQLFTRKLKRLSMKKFNMTTEKYVKELDKLVSFLNKLQKEIDEDCEQEQKQVCEKFDKLLK